jgi:hypothetical protein
MNEFQGIAVMAALFALRCIVPLVVVVLIGYAMNRLAARWDAEEAAQPAAKPPVPLAMASRSAALSVPCWVFKNCDETKRAGCPAYQNPTLACWAALTRAEGRLPARCADCARYTGAPTLAAAD